MGFIVLFLFIAVVSRYMQVQNIDVYIHSFCYIAIDKAI